MDDICKEAGISKKTIYEKITNKADLISLVVKNYVQKERMEIEEIRKESNDAIHEMIAITQHVLMFLRTLKPSVTYDLKKYYLSTWNYLEKTHYAYIGQVIKDNIEQGQKESVYREHINSQIVSKLYMESSKQLVNEDLFPLQEFTKDKLYVEFIEHYMHGILNEVGLQKYKAYKKLL